MTDCGRVDWVMFFLVGGSFLALGTFALMVWAIVRDYYRDGGRGGNV